MKLIVWAALLTGCAAGGHDFPNDDAATDAAPSTTEDASKPQSDGGSTTGNDGGATGAPTLEMVSGNGGTIPSGWPATDPVRVRARDSKGNVVVGDAVTFAVGAGQALHLQILSGDTVTTDTDGVASVTYNAFPISPNVGHEIDTVTATWNGLSVAFTIIITQVPSGAWAAPPLFQISAPDTSPELGSVKAGSTTTGLIRGVAVYQQGSDYGVGVDGWGMRLTKSGDLLSTGDVSCAGAGGTAIADATGHIACDLVAPATPGDYYFSMLAGGQIKWDGHVKVTP
jgi:hypothetical protein